MSLGLLDTNIGVIPALNRKQRPAIAFDVAMAGLRSGIDYPSHGDQTAYVMYKSYSDLCPVEIDHMAFGMVSLPDETELLYQVAQGFDALLRQQVKIICLPFGIDLQSPIFDKIVASCDQKGVLLIAASGNKGQGRVTAPGIHPSVLCVGAADSLGNVTHFSGSYSVAPHECMKPEVLAQGIHVNIPSTNGKTHLASGTSMACARVAGVAAALLSAQPNASSDDIKRAIYQTAVPAPGSRHGMINAAKAMKHIRQLTPERMSPKPGSLPYSTKIPFIHDRLKEQCKSAGDSDLIKALVSAKSTRTLMQRLGDFLESHSAHYTMFENFDVASLSASPAFYKILFEQPDLHCASAVDLNYFD